MTSRVTAFHPRPVVPDRVTEERAAVLAVLASTAFDKVPRLASLLEYICERYFEGDTEAIKEYSIATEVFGRPHTFDQATDSIVRVQVFRLRKKLHEFYDGEGADQPIEIVVATGHYRPQFVDRLPQTGPKNCLADLTATAAPAGPESLAETMEPLWIPEEGEVPLDDPGQPEETLSAGVADSTPTADPADPGPLAETIEPSWISREGEAHPEGPLLPEEILSPQGTRDRFGRRGLLAIVVILATAAVLAMWWLNRGRHANSSGAPPVSSSPEPPLATGPEVRIRCGYSRPIFKDAEGNVWTGDRYFTGGFITELPKQHIARTRTPELYLAARTGVFSYKIPLAPGTYELRLHFAETTYSPNSSLGGGENSRVFDVQLNGRPLLKQFDIVSDAGADTADVRVFRDITPEPDGYLHLDFTGSLGLPIINGIEIVPGLPHRLRPIRMVAQNSFFVDKSGNLWMPDTYYSSGQLAADKVAIAGTPEPDLYTGERYGNFSYALPVDEGSYKLTLYFSEKYWGSDVAKKGGAGSRVFDVLCNGIALTRRLDIVEAVGPGRAFVKTYRRLRPNAQGKLIVSFVPDVNYASVDALEVEEETP
jgi:Malectin domain